MGENNDLIENKLKFDPNKKYPLTWSYMFSYSFRQITNNKCYFCLCLFSCLIVSVIALVANTILAEGPIIFVLVGEGNTGERDFIIKPVPIEIDPKSTNLDNMIFYSELNYTNFITNHPKIIENFNLEDFSTYRFETSVNVKACHDKNINCKEIQSNFYVINSIKEEKMKLGRSYDVKKNKMNEGECIFHEVLAERLNLNYKNLNTSLAKESVLKKEVEIDINLKGIIKNLLIDNYASHKYKVSEDEDYNNKMRNQNLEKINKIALFNSTFKCIVKNTIETPLGKVNGNTKNLILYEADFFFNSVANGINNEIKLLFPDFQDKIRLNKISQKSNTIIINYPDDRLKNYLYSSFELLNKRGVEFIDKILTKPEENLSISKPLIDEMEELFFGAVFFGLILNLVIIIMFSLSIILIYSLLLITMETSTFDLGMMRLIGESKFSLMIITIIQCISFSIPAFLIGYILHFLVLSAVSYQLSQSSGSDISLKQDTFSVVYSFLLCNLCPLISAYFPIKGMLGKNLAESISTNNSKTSGVKVSIVSSINREKKVLITFGLLTVIYGISIYYFLPLSLLSMNFSLLLAIFLWILLGMLIGLIIFTLNLEYLTQKFFTFIFFFWTSTYIRTLVIKNLIAHRLRNRKTSLMFSLSVGFFIMISVGAKLEITSTNLRILSRRGAEINLVSRGDSYSTPKKLNSDLEKLKEKKLIDEYSYLTPLLSTLCDSTTSIMNIGKSSSTNVDVHGISANFYNSTINRFLSIADEGYHYNDMKSMLNLLLRLY